MKKDIWFTSDTHFGHKNIVRGVTGWEDNTKTRNFNTVEEHNTCIVDRINSLVKYDDVLYHLGDWSFGGHENIKVFRDRICCSEIHLILGNHDNHVKPKDSPYRSLFESVNSTLELNLKIDSEKSGKFGKQLFFLSHYAHLVWNKSHHDSIHLFGHSHGNLLGIGRSMDVGVDTHDYYPYHIDEILFMLRDIKTPILDHHNAKTNE